MLYPAQLSVNVEMPAAGSDSPCLAVEEVWRTSPTFFNCASGVSVFLRALFPGL